MYAGFCLVDKAGNVQYYIHMKILCEVSARHVHLRKDDLETLFGQGVDLELERKLSQPGQFLATQRVTLMGPKREMEEVAVLGPVRSECQVELSRTDCFALGIRAELRLSGNLQGTPSIII